MLENELRIGNWVYEHNPNALIAHKILSGYEIDNADLFDPIPLTEEWLERLAFVKTGATFWHKDSGIRFVKFNIPYGASGHGSGFVWGSKTIHHIHHVHTLQNFLYAATGEELTLKNE